MTDFTILEDEISIDYDADYYSLVLTKTHLSKQQAEILKIKLLDLDLS